MDTQPTVVSEINTTAAVDPLVVSVENPFPYGLLQSFIHPPVVTSVQQTMPVAQSGQQAMPVIQNVQQTVPLVPEPPKAILTFTQANVHTRVQPYLNEPVYEILDDNDEGYQPRDRLREEVVTIDKRLRKKEGETHVVSSDRRRNRQYQYPPHYAQPQGYPVQYAPPPYVAAVAPSFNQQAPQTPVYQPMQQIKTPLKAFHSKLFKAGLVSVSHIGCTSCKGCDKGCVMVRKDVQRLIDDGFLQVVNQAKEVAAIEPTFNLPESRGRIPVFNLPAPNSVMPVFSIPTPVTPTVDQPKPLIIQKPSPFPFSDPKAVPWNDFQDCRDIPDILQVISILGDPSSMGSSVPQRNCLTCLRKYFPGILPPGMSVEFSPEAERSPDIPVEMLISSQVLRSSVLSAYA
ncbi:hypothetical protein KIW84_077131 [Lathyrus oleraceus]|uniref:Uncharacterized protein n=1 Tax=Pisum sativum TaxID=3888 RepID=A0A9D4W029_PEA|nr:hypothetical protein KIW84_077131 [Pisum sativum]